MYKLHQKKRGGSEPSTAAAWQQKLAFFSENLPLKEVIEGDLGKLAPCSLNGYAHMIGE